MSEAPANSAPNTSTPNTSAAAAKTSDDLSSVQKPSVWKALGKRKTGAMAVLGFAAGLPYALITGTLLAWFTEEGVDIKTIGVFSWVILIYSFKFLWAPGVDRLPAPGVFSMGQRRAGILFLQALIIIALATISFASPQNQLGLIAAAAVVCTFASSCQDVLIDAWRIEIADEEITVDLLSSVYQIGYRLATILGGAGALIMAARIGWNSAFVALAVLMALAVCGVFIAEDSTRAPSPDVSQDKDGPPTNWRNLALLPVLAGWAWAFVALFGFMAFALQAPGEANARVFTREKGPLIVLAAVVAPMVCAAALLWLRERKTLLPRDNSPWFAQSVLDTLYGAVLTPLSELIERLRFGAILVIALVLSYRFVDLVWGAFAYPFYLGVENGALGHTLDEVAIASKLFGTLMTFLGIGVGAAAILRFGRMPCVVAGAILAAATNLLFADLALGGAGVDAFMRAARLYPVFSIFQPLADFLGLDVTMNERLARLMVAIAAENLALGFASAASVVYLSSIVSPRFAAVQYALLASLVMLIGSLGRGALGELIGTRGFAYVFYLTAVLGLFAVVASILEWIRQARGGAAEPTRESAPA
ncbi:MAG: MFS transporter [Pseudomonadota bacterium]